MFDSFSRATIMNLGKNARRQHFSQANRQAVYDKIMLAETKGSDEIYPSHSFLVYADELSCEINHEFLYKAFIEMSVELRKVLILDFWHGWKDKEIADRLGVTVRTVYNMRQRAYRTILFYGEQKDTEAGTVARPHQTRRRW